MKFFLQIGITVLSFILVTCILLNYCATKVSPQLATTLSQGIENKKLLPIYCVDAKKPQIALSFDAAWGAYCLM